MMSKRTSNDYFFGEELKQVNVESTSISSDKKQLVMLCNFTTKAEGPPKLSHGGSIATAFYEGILQLLLLQSSSSSSTTQAADGIPQLKSMKLVFQRPTPMKTTVKILVVVSSKKKSNGNDTNGDIVFETQVGAVDDSKVFSRAIVTFNQSSKGNTVAVNVNAPHLTVQFDPFAAIPQTTLPDVVVKNWNNDVNLKNITDSLKEFEVKVRPSGKGGFLGSGYVTGTPKILKSYYRGVNAKDGKETCVVYHFPSYGCKGPEENVVHQGAMVAVMDDCFVSHSRGAAVTESLNVEILHSIPLDSSVAVVAWTPTDQPDFGADKTNNNSNNSNSNNNNDNSNSNSKRKIYYLATMTHPTLGIVAKAETVCVKNAPQQPSASSSSEAKKKASAASKPKL